MTGERFSLDANLLFYAVDRQAGRKHEIAEKIAARSLYGDCVLALQAIGEFFAAVTRKRALSHADAADIAREWMSIFVTVAQTDATLDKALRLAADRRYAIWDATLLTCLEANSCHFLLTEDMQAGARFGDLRIINPFTGAMPEALGFLLTDD